MTKISKRYTLLDALRGLTLISMVVYHAMWDLKNIFDVELSFWGSEPAQIWQASIRWTFILLSGFCWALSRSHLRRGLIVLGASVVISAVTAIVMPESIILFGVLTFIGSAMLLTIPLDKLFRKISPYIGLAVSFLLFLLTETTKRGSISIFGRELFELPNLLYANLLTAYFGFPAPAFHSSDYVPLIPWLFMFWCGYFLYRIFERHDLLKYLSAFRVKALEWIGRHSLVIYMLHQPIVYALLYVFFKLF